MKENTIKTVISESGDWKGLYINDILESEGHAIYWIDTIQKYRHFTGEVEGYEVSDEYMEEIGLPLYFNEIDKSELKEY